MVGDWVVSGPDAGMDGLGNKGVADKSVGEAVYQGHKTGYRWPAGNSRQL